MDSYHSKVVKQNQIQKHFDAQVDYWHYVYEGNSYNSYLLQKRMDYVVETCKTFKKQGQILDLGCGVGLASLELTRLGYQVSGLDVSSKMIKRAQQEAKRRKLHCNFQVGAAEKLPYPDCSFDMVIAMGLIEYATDVNEVLKEILRVLRPNGLLLANAPNSFAAYRFIAFPRSLSIMLGPEVKRRFRLVENKLRALLRLPPKDISKAWLGRALRPASFLKTLTNANFKDVGYSSLTFGPIHPFGIPLWNHKVDIRISEYFTKLSKRVKWLSRFGGLIVYKGVRKS